MDKAVVLLSGGLDSTTLLHYVRKRLGAKELYALSFDYGQKHVKELEMAMRQADVVQAEKHKIIDISFVSRLISGSSALTDESIEVPDLADLSEDEKKQPPTYVPNRNMILISLAAAYAEAHGTRDIFYAAQAQDEYGYWDCTERFLQALNRVMALNRGEPVTIHAPFVGMKKSKILGIGADLGVDYSHTWTCYRGEHRPCGSCPTCIERATAFTEAGLKDPLIP